MIKRFLIFVSGVGLSLFLAMWLEFFYKFGATSDPQNFFGSLIIYIPYLFIFHIFAARFKDARLWVLYCVGGFVGMMGEWFLVGHAPWNSSLVTQPMMFVFHAFYPVAGYVCVRFEKAEIRRLYLAVIIVIMSGISSLGFLIDAADWRFAWFLWVPMIFYFWSSMILLRVNKKLARI